jgi:hypothetical protein
MSFVCLLLIDSGAILTCPFDLIVIFGLYAVNIYQHSLNLLNYCKYRFEKDFEIN